MANLYYNPFFLLTDGLLEHLLKSGKRYWIVQRFNWPGMKKGFAFLASEYGDLIAAREHEAELRDKEGKLLDMEDEETLEHLRKLIQPSSGYQIYYNGTIDEKNEKKLQDAYVKKVHGYIQSTGLKKGPSGFDVVIRVVYGRVTGIIYAGEKTHTALFYDMIK